MENEKTAYLEETLDPEDWEKMRRLGHRVVDDMVAYMQDLRENPVWQHAPVSVKEHFQSTVPEEPQPVNDIYDEYLRYVHPYLLGNSHPRFWGWVTGTGTPMGVIAEMIAAATDSPSGAFSYMSANYVEDQVLNWFKEILGYPPESSGLLTSGCSASNLIGLAVARNTKAGYNLRLDGLRSSPRNMVLYASSEVHSSIQKTVELLGLGGGNLRKIPVNGALQMNLQALIEVIYRDRKEGEFPFCIVGAAGTTNTGAIDDLEALADICQEENLWFHVDGAFGAWAAISPESKHLVAGMERADSLAFDLHKWMYLSYDIACVLIRDEESHRHAFSLTPTYLAHGEGNRGLTGVDIPWKSDYGFQLSRGFPALKAWMTLKEHGVQKFGRVIQGNIDQAHYLAGLVTDMPELELALPVSLNVVNFRYICRGVEDETLDEVNKQIEIELQERGIAVLSIVVIHGRKYLHAAITNHRSQKRDFDLLVDDVVRIGEALVSGRV